MIHPSKFKLSKFVGRDVRPTDEEALERIKQIFAAAGKPTVWQAATEWQHKHKVK